MTTQTTSIRTSTHGLRALIGAAAAGLALTGGALLWQARPASEAGAPAAATTIGRASEGIAPMGGLAELYRDQRAAAGAEAALGERIGGMAELYRAQAPARRTDACGLDAQDRAC